MQLRLSNALALGHISRVCSALQCSGLYHAKRLTFTSQGTPISGGDDFAIRIWGETPRILGSHKGKVSALAVAPDGGVLASGSWDGSVALWSLDDGTQTELPYPGAGVNALAFSPNGKLLFVTTSQGLVLRYDLENLKSRPIARHGFGVNKLIVKDDWIAYGAVDGGTRIIDHEGREIADFTLDRRPILSMAHHGPSSQLAVGDGHSYIMMIDTQRWKITKDFRAFRKGPVWALAFSNGGETLYAGGLDSVIYAWPVALLDAFEPAQGETRAFLRDTATMPNGERQFMRKCSICHALTAGASRKAGPSLHGLFGRAAGVLPDYKYSPILANSSIVWKTLRR